MRRSIGTWAYRYWLKRLEQACEINRISLRTMAPFYTSQTCPSCGHVDRGNRVGQVFQCLSCGHAGNADIIAARNILTRFFTGLYGARYKPYVFKGTVTRGNFMNRIQNSRTQSIKPQAIRHADSFKGLLCLSSMLYRIRLHTWVGFKN